MAGELTQLTSQLARTKSKLKDLQEGLDAAIDDNLRLRNLSEAKDKALDDRLAALRAVVRASSERVVVTDVEARILCMSQSAATLVGARSNEVEGRPSADVLKFFDAYKDNPREYPLTALVPDLIQRGSAMLMMTDVVLLDGRQNEKKMMLLSEAVLNPSGTVVGSLLRLQDPDEDGDSKAKPMRERTDLRDATTDLPTRGEFISRLIELIHTASAQSATHQLLLIAVDNLQEIYDDIGYWAGEELLWSIAQLIRAELSGHTELFRITAVHFALLLPQCKAAPADRVAESIRLSVESAQFSWNERHYRSTVSIGVCEIDGDTQGTTAVISLADGDLRVARSRGGNRVQRHRADDLLLETQAVESRLVKWLDDDDNAHLQLQSCEYQPADHSAVPLVGAMLRVELDDGFWIDPVAFQSSADNSGLSSRIDLWLLRRSLSALESMVPSEDEGLPRVLVPVSGHSLENKTFLTQLRVLVAESGRAGERVVLTLDEREARNRPGLTKRFRKELTELGIGFALRACRVAALADLIPRLKPDFVGVAAHVVQNVRGAGQHEINYFQAVAEELRFKLFAEAVDGDELRHALHRAGIHLVGDKGGPMGPLSEFAGLQLQIRKSS